jgi:hypothetical protein
MKPFGSHLVGPWYETDDGAVSTRGWTKVKRYRYTNNVMLLMDITQGDYIIDDEYVLFKEASDATMYKLKTAWT